MTVCMYVVCVYHRVGRSGTFVKIWEGVGIVSIVHKFDNVGWCRGTIQNLTPNEILFLSKILARFAETPQLPI